MDVHMSDDRTEELKKTGLSGWYSSLQDRDRVRADRYLEKADTVSSTSCLSSMASAALDDENFQFSAALCEECLKNNMPAIERFDVTELLIEAYIGSKRYDDAKYQCECNLKLYPSVSKEIIARNNGTLPEKMNCRNRYVDVVIGIESGYDEAFRLLDRFLKMGLISKEDHAFRERSLRIHRLQRSFDGVYTFSYRKE